MARSRSLTTLRQRRWTRSSRDWAAFPSAPVRCCSGCSPPPGTSPRSSSATSGCLRASTSPFSGSPPASAMRSSRRAATGSPRPSSRPRWGRRCSTDSGRGPALLLAAGAVVSSVGTVALASVIRRGNDERAPDTIARLSASAAAVAAGSTLALAGLAAAGMVPGVYGWYWANGFLAQLAGMTIAGPWLRAWLRPAARTIASRWEVLAMLAVSGGIAETVGTGVLGRGGPAAYLVFPPILWAALRGGRRGVTTASLVIGVDRRDELQPRSRPLHRPRDERARWPSARSSP